MAKTSDANKQVKRGRGRPPLPEKTRQVTLILSDTLDERLTELTFEMWRQSRKKVAKSEVVRAVLNALFESKLDLRKVQSAEELQGLIASRLGK